MNSINKYILRALLIFIKVILSSTIVCSGLSSQDRRSTENKTTWGFSSLGLGNKFDASAEQNHGKIIRIFSLGRKLIQLVYLFQ